MTSVQLLTLAGALTKDPDHDEYISTVKYSMLSSGQEAIINIVDPEYLNSAKLQKAHAGITHDTEFNLESDFLRHAYFETSTGREIEFVDLENKGKLLNSHEGGTQTRPIWYYYNKAGTLTGKVLCGSGSLTNPVQYYIQKPPTLSDSQNPIITGFDSQILAYFKYMFHLAEGQYGLAETAYKAFLAGLQPFVKDKDLVQEKEDKQDG
jgi:hypothetical protein